MVPTFYSRTYPQQEGGWKGQWVEYRRTSSPVEKDQIVSGQSCKHDWDSCPSSSSENKPASHATINQQLHKRERKDNCVSADSLQSLLHTSIAHQYSDSLIHGALSAVWSHVHSGVQHVSHPLESIYSATLMPIWPPVNDNIQSVFWTHRAGCAENKSTARYLEMFLWLRIRG